MEKSAQQSKTTERPAGRIGQITAVRRQYRHASIKQPTWQNPLIEYYSAISKRHRTPRPRPPRRVRLERQILSMLAFFAVSIGLWENFRQLWLQDNSFSITGVSNITSIGMLASVLGVICVGKFVKMRHIKQFMSFVLVVRTFILFMLFLLNLTGPTWLISVLIVLDILSGSLIVSSVYPLLTTVMKSNNAYSRRKLVEYLFRDVGIVVGAILIGRTIGTFIVDYNTCLLVAVAFVAISAGIMWKMEVEMTERAPAQRFSVLKLVLRSRIQRFYMGYAFVAGTAFAVATGLRMLVLTDYFNFSAGMATTYLLIVGLASDVLGILALKYFTPKNDNVTIFIKFGTRMLIFGAAFFSGDLFTNFLALTWAMLSSTAYENVTDGYYINAIDNRHQLKYNNFKYVVTFSGEATGMFLAGQMYTLGVPYIFGLAGALVIIQIFFSLHLIQLRLHQRRT